MAEPSDELLDMVRRVSVVSAVIKLEGTFKVPVSIRFQFCYFVIHTDTDCSLARFCFNVTGEKKNSVMDGCAAEDHIH